LFIGLTRIATFTHSAFGAAFLPFIVVINNKIIFNKNIYYSKNVLFIVMFFKNNNFKIKNF
jgi:hypothetical protein